MSYELIASHLNLEGVPTKRKSTKWHSQTVSNIVRSINGRSNQAPADPSTNRRMVCVGIALPLARTKFESDAEIVINKKRCV